MADSLRILILEDNQTDAELVQFELQETGLVFEPKVVTTKKDYVIALQKFLPDLILSDYDLPRYNGALALAEARKSCPDTPFILVTGAVSEDRAIEILTQGAKDYVLKTRLQQRLGPAVKRALTEAEEHRARKRAEEKLHEAHRNLENQVAQRTAELEKQIEHRSRIEAALHKYNERLEILSSTAGQLLVSDKPQQLVEKLCRTVMKFLDCQTFFNFLVDESAGRLHLNACAGIPPETVRKIEWLDFGTAVCGCVARDGARIVAENIPETPDIRTDLIKSFGIKAYACHPLMQQQHVIGTISFGTRTRTHFSNDDLAMMKAVADQVAIAMSRVRTEEELRKITERFDMAQHVAEVGTWDWDIVNGSIRWSTQMFNLFRLDPRKSKASFELWETILHPDDVNIAGLRIEEALKKKALLNSDYRIILPDGQIRWINSVGEGKYNDQDQAIRMIGICMDITDRKQTEEALRESEERYRELVQSSPEAVIVHRDGHFLYANPAALRLYGARSLDQLQTKTVLDLIPDEERVTIASRMKNGKSGKKLSLQETKLTRLDGQVIPVESVGGAVTYDGKPAVQIMIRDITERKQAEEALRLMQQRLSVIVGSIADGFFAVDRQWRFTHINDKALKHFHKTSDEIIGRNLFEIFPQAQGTNFETNYRQAMESGKPVHFEAESTIDDIVMELFVYPGPESMTVLFRDISEKNRQAKALAEYHEQVKWLARFPEENPNPVIRANEDGMVLYCNSSSEKDPGWACKVGTPLNEALMPAFTEAVSEKREVEQEIMIGALHYAITVTPFPAESYANIYGHEITRRKLAEEALQKNERIKSELLSNLNEAQHMAMVGSWEWDLRTDHVLWSDETYRIFGVTPQDFVPGFESNGKFIHPDDFDLYGQVFEHSLQTGEPLDFNLRLLTRDGLLKYCNAKGRVIYDDDHHPLRFVGTIMDITELTKREKEREKNNRTLHALSKSNQAMMRAADECGYMEEVCKIVVEDCGYTMVWIGFAEDDEGKTVRPVAYSGFEEGYIDTLKITWADTERGRGPTGTTIRTGKLTACRNMLVDPLFKPWREEAIKRGYASSIVLPLTAGGKAFGALTIYSKEPDPFTEDEEKLLAELANDLSYGITAIRWREALRESEEKYKNLVKYAPAAIYEMDIQGTKFLSVNDVMCDILGYSREELLALKPAYFLAEESRAIFRERIKKKISGGRIEETTEYKVKRKDGQWIDITVNVGTISYMSEKSPRVAVIAHDITERKRTEEAILRAKDEWERTFDTVPDLIAILDDRHRIVRVNKAMASSLNVLPEHCVGMPCHEAVHGLSNPPAFCPHSLTCRDGRQHVAEVHEPRIGGDFLVSTTPLYDGAGQLVGSVHVARDITERKLAEDQLAKQAAQLQERTAQMEEANRELESFSYSISHDLRAPLRAIDGFSRKLEREYGDKLDEKFASTLNVIRSNSKLMGVLIENLLSFSRVQKIDMKSSVIDMDKLVNDVWNDLRAIHEERELEFKLTTILPGYGDRTLIRQVLFNLLANAVKFTKDKKPGIIEMSSYAQAERVVYCIKDNGVGFDMEYYEKLFGVFQRLHTSEEFEGTGIGLAIVQRIVVRHGGSVWAEGKINEGATFFFSLSSCTP